MAVQLHVRAAFLLAADPVALAVPAVLADLAVALVADPVVALVGVRAAHAAALVVAPVVARAATGGAVAARSSRPGQSAKRFSTRGQ